MCSSSRLNSFSQFFQIFRSADESSRNFHASHLVLAKPLGNAVQLISCMVGVCRSPSPSLGVSSVLRTNHLGTDTCSATLIAEGEVEVGSNCCVFSIWKSIRAVTGSDQARPREAPPEQRALRIFDKPAAWCEPFDDVLGPQHQRICEHEVARRSASCNAVIFARAARPDDVVVPPRQGFESPVQDVHTERGREARIEVQAVTLMPRTSESLCNRPCPRE